MKGLGKPLAYAGAALGVLGSISGIVAWLWPSSATWINRHGLAAWPVAILCLVSFTWAVSSLGQSRRELESLRRKTVEPLTADRELFKEFKQRLPKDSRSLVWLRQAADSSHYYDSDRAALADFRSYWESADCHFIYAELERAAGRLVNALNDFLDFQALHSEVSPNQTAESMVRFVLFRVIDYQRDDQYEVLRIRKGMTDRADKLLEAYNDLYVAGSRLGM